MLSDWLGYAIVGVILVFGLIGVALAVVSGIGSVREMPKDELWRGLRWGVVAMLVIIGAMSVINALTATR